MNVPVKTRTTFAERPEATVVSILVAASVCHCLNDTIQSLLPAIYPILKTSFQLDFGEIGLITFVFQVTASLLQPFVGLYTDRRPQPYSLPIGMGFSLPALLQEKVPPVEFDETPFADAMRQLSEMTGVTILLDPRLQEKAKTAISADFRGDTAPRGGS